MKKILSTLVMVSALLSVAENSAGMEISEVFKDFICVNSEDLANMKELIDLPTLSEENKVNRLNVFKDISDPLKNIQALKDKKNRGVSIELLLTRIFYAQNKYKDQSKFEEDFFKQDKKVIEDALSNALYQKGFLQKKKKDIESILNFLSTILNKKTAQLSSQQQIIYEDLFFLNNVIVSLYNLCAKMKEDRCCIAEHKRVSVICYIVAEEKAWINSLLLILRKLKETQKEENILLNKYIARLEIRNSMLDVALRIYSEVYSKIDGYFDEEIIDAVGADFWKELASKMKKKNNEKYSEDVIIGAGVLIPWLSEVSADILESFTSFGMESRCVESCNNIIEVYNAIRRVLSPDCSYYDLEDQSLKIFEALKAEQQMHSEQLENISRAVLFLKRRQKSGETGEIFKIVDVFNHIATEYNKSLTYGNVAKLLGEIKALDSDTEIDEADEVDNVDDLMGQSVMFAPENKSSYGILGDNCMEIVPISENDGRYHKLFLDFYKGMVPDRMEKVVRNFIKKANFFGNRMKIGYPGAVSNINFNNINYAVFSILPDNIVIDAAYSMEFLRDSADFDGENNFLNKFYANNREYSVIILRTIENKKNNYLFTRIPIEGRDNHKDIEKTKKTWQNLVQKRIELLQKIGKKEADIAFNNMMYNKSFATSIVNTGANYFGMAAKMVGKLFSVGVGNFGDEVIAASSGQKAAELKNDMETNRQDRQKLLDQLGGNDLEYVEFLASRGDVLSDSLISTETKNIEINELDQASARERGHALDGYLAIFPNDPLFCLKKLNYHAYRSIRQSQSNANAGALKYLKDQAVKSTNDYYDNEQRQKKRESNVIKIRQSDGTEIHVLKSLPKNYSLRRLLPIWKLKITEGPDIVVSVAVVEDKKKNTAAYFVPLFGLNPSFKEERALLEQEENAVITIAKTEALLKRITSTGKSVSDLMQMKDILFGEGKFLNVIVDKSTDLYIQRKLDSLVDEGNKAIKNQQEIRKRLIELYNKQNAEFMITDDMQSDVHKEFEKVDIQNLKRFVAKKSMEAGIKVSEGVIKVALEVGGSAGDIVPTILKTTGNIAPTVFETAMNLPLPSINSTDNVGGRAPASSSQPTAHTHANLTNPGVIFGMSNSRAVNGQEKTANFCYIDATLQLLFAYPEMANVKLLKSRQSTVFSTLHNIYTRQKTVENSYGELMSQISKPNFAKYSQQDAAEFLEGVLLNCPELNCSFEEGNTYICPKGHIGKRSHTSYLFRLPMLKSKKIFGKHSLQEMFDADLRDDSIERNCDAGNGKNTCGEAIATHKKSVIAKDTLFVQIMRFNNNLEVDRTAINIPSNITVCGQKFAVVGIINHSGNLKSGHYTALVLRDGTWYECNDNSIEKKADIFSSNTYSDGGNAYIVMLKKIPEKK